MHLVARLPGSMPVAAAAAVAAAKTGRRVRYSLSRNDDMRINGGERATCLHPLAPVFMTLSLGRACNFLCLATRGHSWL